MTRLIEFAALWFALVVLLFAAACIPPPRGPWLVTRLPPATELTPPATIPTSTLTSTTYQDHLPPGDMSTITPTPTLLPTIVPGRNRLTPPVLPVTGAQNQQGIDPPDCYGAVIIQSVGDGVSQVDCLGVWKPRRTATRQPTVVEPTATATPFFTETWTPTPTAIPTDTPSSTLTQTSSPTLTATGTSSPTPTMTWTATATSIPSATSTSTASAGPSVTPTPTFTVQLPQLVFDDEFDTLDWNKWTLCDWADGGQECRSLNAGDQSIYLRRNLIVENGVLKIITRREPYTGSEYPNVGKSFEFTSSMLSTAWRQYFTPPFLAEARILQPQGIGLWSAWWLLRRFEDGAPRQEVDLEYLARTPDRWYATVHFPESGTQTAPLSPGWHVYAALVEPGRVTWFLDGTPVRTWYSPDVAAYRMFLLLDVAIGGWGGAIDPGFSKSEMLVDWVRVWK